MTPNILRKQHEVNEGFWTFQRTAGALLIAGIVPLSFGLFLFNQKRAGAPYSATLFAWEKGFVVAAVVLTALGFVMLEAKLHEANGRVLARLGANVYFFGAVLLATAEVMRLSAAASLIVVYVFLALLGQAAIGGALLRSKLLPTWIGWTTIVWNLILLIVFLIITPGDIYYPIAHHLMPMLIGVPLLVETTQENSQSRTARVGWGVLIIGSVLLFLAYILWHAQFPPMMTWLALLVTLEGYRSGSRWAWIAMWVLVAAFTVVAITFTLAAGSIYVPGFSIMAIIAFASVALVGLLLARKGLAE